MKVGLLSGLSAIAVTAAAVQAQALTVSPEVNSLSYTHLAKLNQSQTFETLSLAGGVTRLPASAYKTAGVYFITNNKEQISVLPEWEMNLAIPQIQPVPVMVSPLSLVLRGCLINLAHIMTRFTTNVVMQPTNTIPHNVPPLKN